MIEIKEIKTWVLPTAVSAVWRTQRKHPKEPHGVALVVGGYDRRAYFETEKERDDAIEAILEAIASDGASDA